MSWFCYGSCEGWRHYVDPAPDGRASVAGDGPYGHAVWLSEPGSARAGSAQARCYERWSFLLQGQTRRSFEGDLARWPKRLERGRFIVRIRRRPPDWRMRANTARAMMAFGEGQAA